MPLAEIFGYIVLILLICSVYILPKTVGEYRGVYKQDPDLDIGRLEKDCKWVHGISFSSGMIGLFILFPIELIIYDLIYSNFGVYASVIFLSVLLIILTYYIIKTSKVNSEIALKKNEKEVEVIDKELEIIEKSKKIHY